VVMVMKVVIPITLHCANSVGDTAKLP